jgi:hypothetical protein
MFTIRISRMMMIGVVLSMLALLVAWPVLAERPSGAGLTSFSTIGEREQREIVRNQLAASGFSLEATAPSALPVTGVTLSGYGTARGREQWEIVVNELAASGIQVDMGSPAILPVTGLSGEQASFSLPRIETHPDSGLGDVLDLMTGVIPGAFIPGAPGQLPVTGAQVNPYLGLLEQYRQMYGGSSDPARLPVTGARADPYLELLEQYREMYGGH